MPRNGLPKVTQYVKNVGKSVAFATINGISDNLDGIKSFADDNKEVFTEMYASVKNYRQSIRKAEINIKRSNVYKAVDYGIKNIIDDLKTGNFYNTSRSEDIAETALGLDDDSLDYDFSYKVSDSSSESSSNSINDAIGAIASSNSTVVAQSTDLMIKTNKISTNLITTQIERSTAVLSSSIGALYNVTNKTNQFLNGPMLNHLENSKTYYENSLRIMQDQQAMMKELLEMQRNLYKTKSKEYSSTRLENSMNYNGTINLKGYLKNVKSNISGLMDSYGLSMFDLSGDTGMNPLMLMAAAPLKMVLDTMVEKIMPKNLKGSLKSFDGGFSSLFSQLISRISKNKAKGSSDSGLMDIITQIFGIDIKKKTTIDPSNYNKGPVPFDGMVRQSIIEVIPGYLARIEAILTGSNERFYDFNRGTWKSTNQIRKEFNDERKRAISGANYDIRSDLQKTLNNMSKEMAEDIRESMYKFMEKVFDDYGDLKLDLVKDKNGSYKSADGSNAWKYYGFKNKNQFDVFLKSINISTIRNLAHNNLLAIEQYSKTLENNELNGSTYTKLFNNSINDKNGNPNFTAGGNLLSLSKDKYGHDVFYYLREILSGIRNRSNSGYTLPESGYQTSFTASIGGSSRESETSSESEDDPGSWSDIEAELDKNRFEEHKKNQSKKATGNWIKGKFGNSVIGRFLNTIGAGTSNIFSTPVKYMTELLDRASDNMFTMMFGDSNKYSNLKDDEGNSINSIFEYMIYKVDKSFKDLVNKVGNGVNTIIDGHIRPFISKYIKPLFDKYGRPIIDEVISFGRRAGVRVREGINNTFGKAYRSATRPKDTNGYRYEDDLFNMASNLANGGVVTADDVEAASDSDGYGYNKDLFSARGRLVTKRGLTMISPGEIIIPASFDSRTQNRMLTNEKKDRNRILKAFGKFGSGRIGLNAKGTVDTEELKRKLQDIYHENIGDNKGAKVGAGGIIGGLAGLLTGINPLLGAAAGAGISILNNSETLKNVVFGEVGDDGERTGGIVSKKIYDVFKKAAPDMGDFGIAGGLLGLVTPFGPLAGAAIGAGVGFLKNSESFKKFIFGDEASGKEGFIKKESFDKFKATVKKAAPSILLGAGAGILAGPFGLLGNAAMGAGLGLVSSTDEFNKFLFGRENSGGLLSAFQNGILEPAKQHILEIAADLKSYAKENILDPMKKFWEPFKQDIRNIIQGTADGIKDHINDMFEKTIGLPLADFLQEKVFKPITNGIFKILKAPLTIGKAIVSAPFKLLGLYGEGRTAKQIRRGNAYNMSASERLAFRDSHKFRFNRFRSDKTLEQDRTLAGLGMEDLEMLESASRAGLISQAELQNRLGKANQAIGSDISEFFNEKNEKGATRFTRVNYKLVNELAKTASSGDIEGVYAQIDSMNLTDDEKKALKNRLKDKIAASIRARNELDLANKGGKELDSKLEELLGRKVKGRKDRRSIMKSAEAELRARRKGAIKDETPEENATNNLAEIVDNKTNTIIADLSTIKNYLQKLIDPESASKDTTSTSNKAAALKDKMDGNVDNQSISTDIAVKEDINKRTKKKSWIRNIFDQVTGRFIPDNPDSKEAVENEKERELIRSNEAQNTEENKKTNTILSRMSNFFFGKKGDREDEGLLSKLFKGVKKFGKFIGIAGLALTGVSLFGHATEWFKTSIWPRIKETLFGKTSEDGTTVHEGLIGGLVNRGKALLFGEDGESGLIGKIKTFLLGNDRTGEPGLIGKIKELPLVRTLTDTVTEIRTAGIGNWIGKKIVPKLVAGWGYAVNNILPPIIGLAIKALPHIIGGIATALIKGISIAILNKKQLKTEAITTDISADISEITKATSGMNSSLKSNVSNRVSSMFNTRIDSTPSNYSIAVGDIVNSIMDPNYRAAEDTYDVNGNNLNKDSNEILYRDGILGSKKSTNQIFYDENGNIAVNAYDQHNTTESIASQVAKTSGRGFLRSLLGAAPSTALGTALTKISARGTGRGLFKVGTGIVGGSLKTAGNIMNAGTNLGTGINNLMRRGLFNGSQALEFAETVSAAGGGSVDNILAAINKNGLVNTAKDMIRNTSDDAVKHAVFQAGRAANINILDHENLFVNIADDAVEAAVKNSADNAAVAAANVFSDTAVNSMINTIKEGARNSADNIGTKIVGIFGELASNNTIMKKLLAACSKETTEAIMRETLEKLAKKLGTIIGEFAENALMKVSSAISKFSPITIFFWVWDFIQGYDNAETMLGVAKGDTYKVTFGHRCLMGLLNMINNQLTLGLIPTSTIVDIIVEFLFPLFGLDAASLNEARANWANVIDEWNKNNPYETYTNLEDYNNKDDITALDLLSYASYGTMISNNPYGVTMTPQEYADSVNQGWNYLFNNNNNGSTTGSSNPSSAGRGRRRRACYGKARSSSSNNRAYNSARNMIQNEIDSWNIKNANSYNNLEKFTTNDSSIDNINYNNTRVLTMPTTLLGISINAVSEKIMAMAKSLTSNNTGRNTDKNKIKKALNGSISVFSNEYWKNSRYDGLFGGLSNVQVYMEKVLNAPIALVADISSSISTTLTKLKNFFGTRFKDIWTWFKNFFNPNSTNTNSGTKFNTGTNTVNNRANKAFGRRNVGLGNHLYQSDEYLSRLPYGDSTIGEAGCAPVAATNLLNNLDTGTNIYEAASFAEQNRMTVPGGGTDIKYFNSFLGSKGIPTRTTNSRSAVMNALRDGNQVIMLGRDNHDNPGAPFGSIPHYVTAKSISPTGNIIAEDPDLPNSSIEYAPSDIMGSMITSVIADVNGRKRKMSANNRKAAAKLAARARARNSLARKEMSKIRYGLGNMLGPEAVLNVARSQIGVEEGPKPNENKYNNAYWNYPSYRTQDDWQWCVVFVWWVFNQAGASKLFYDGGKIAYVGNGGLNDFYARKGKYSKSDPKPGDIAVVKWDTNSPQHAAIVESVNGNMVRIIDGNSNINGHPGIVANHDISMNEIHGFCHIDYPYEYDKSSVIDMSKYGDKTNYESIARNGGYMDDSSFNNGNSSSTSDTSEESSTGSTLLDSLSKLGKSMVKAIYGENAYNALFGTTSTSAGDNENSSNIPVSSSSKTSSLTSLSGNSNAEKIWSYLRSKGYSKHGTAGIMGNLYAESGYNPINVQNTYESVVGSDTEYTNKVNNKSYSKNSFTNDEAGYGLAQWTYPTLKQWLYENTVEKGIGVGDLKGQLDYLDKEMYRHSSLGNFLRNATNYSDASDKFLEQYENPAYRNYDDRRQFAKAAFDTFSNESNNANYTPLVYNYTYDDDINIHPNSNNNPARSNPNRNKFTSSPNSAVTGKFNENRYVAMGRKRKPAIYNAGGATRALNQVSSSISKSGNNIRVNNNYNTNTSVDYYVFLQTIVEILTSIAGNTALLSKILEILSTKLDIDIDKSEIARAASISKAKTEQTLNDLINRNGGMANMSKVLNNKDTSYLLSAMSAIASE